MPGAISGQRMRLDSVEIKFTVGGDQVDDAVGKLGLDPDRQPGSIYFCEDVGAAVSLCQPDHTLAIMRV
jgi:hypothetical protein